jgi:hypothetical protein
VEEALERLAATLQKWARTKRREALDVSGDTEKLKLDWLAKGYDGAADLLLTADCPAASTQPPSPQAEVQESSPDQIARRVREETERSLGGKFSPEGQRAVETVVADLVSENFCPCGARIEPGTGGMCPSCIEHAEAD